MLKSKTALKVDDVPVAPVIEPVKPNLPMVYQKDKIEAITGNSCELLNAEEMGIASKVAMYIEKMNANVQVNETTGANNQLELYHFLNKIFGHKPSRFKILYRWLLITVGNSRKSKGAFCDRYAMRFHSWMNLSTSELTLYRRLLNLVLVTADIKAKNEVVSKVDIRSITETMKDRIARDNILMFYFN